ncbi:MAG: alpha/beta hydrolase-fold protein, partial [Ignavibacteriae bacterium]|nr:alpha/beta hydrolase-fold protein [Ignavibacteriota bacterium]
MNKILFLLLIFSINLFSQTNECKIIIDGTERTYLIHLPETGTLIYNLPLIIVLHGHGGTGKQIMKESGFNKLADRDRFIVIYPDGLHKAWNDGRAKSEKGKMGDDAKFIAQLIDTIYKQYSIDTSRIFATGISNGGFFSFYLAYKLSNKFLAIAPVCANIPDFFKDKYTPDNPVSLMLINGTEDPLVKYEGGKIGFKFGKSRGKSISTDETIYIFKKLNKCSDKPKVEEIPDINKDDECYATKYIYSGGIKNTEVVLIKITNGGHTWPGGNQYLPKTIVGTTCQDFYGAD